MVPADQFRRSPRLKSYSEVFVALNTYLIPRRLRISPSSTATSDSWLAVRTVEILCTDLLAGGQNAPPTLKFAVGLTGAAQPMARLTYNRRP